LVLSRFFTSDFVTGVDLSLLPENVANILLVMLWAWGGDG